ncbi:MAG: V-type ATPase subunit [Nitrospirota bacterium]
MSASFRQSNDRDAAFPDGPRGLLKQGRERGYPVEYLLSRIRGRRSRLIRDWRPLVYESTPIEFIASAQYQGFVRERTAEGMWRALLREHGWVFGQMEEEVRRIFAPYLLYTELRTVFICLRCLHGDRTQKAGEVLAVSLLADSVKNMLRDGETSAAVERLERLFCRLSPEFTGLAANYEEQGLREVEQHLSNSILISVIRTPLHPVMKEFFSRIIDARNILSLYKSLRSGAKDPAVFIAGGTIATGQLKDLLEKDDLFAVVSLIRQASGISIAAPAPTQVEVALYRGITKYLHKEGRDPLGAELILDYLWRCSLEVMNLSLLLAGKDLEREEIAAELVW